MDGRVFLDSARRLAQGSTEADWRSSAGRAYYAIFIEARDSLLRLKTVIPRRDPIHSFVRLRFALAADGDCKRIGRVLDRLGRLRNEADYQTGSPGKFGSATEALQVIQEAHDAIALLDQIEADPARRTSAIAAIQATITP
jgi:uncharacterized protein (UPF0332 family)